MKLEKLVLAVGGTSMLVGGIAGMTGLITSHRLLKLAGLYSLGFGVLVGFIPLFLLLGISFFSKKGG